MGYEIFALFFLLATGTAGFYIFKKLKFLLPALLGSLIATSILAFAGLFPSAAPIERITSISKIVLGIIIGRRINRNSAQMLFKVLLFPALLVSVWMVALSIIMGFSISWLFDMPLSTALFSSSTGGVVEMTFFALSMNYDVATITVIGVTRLVLVLVITTWIAKKWAARFGSDAEKNDTKRLDNDHPVVQKSNISKGGILTLILLSAAGGFLFERLNIPAGLMLGSVLFSAIYFLVSDKRLNLNINITYAVQIVVGISIAKHFNQEQLAYLTSGIFWASLITCIIITLIGTISLAFLLHKFTKWDPLTCLLATAAGGISQMVIVSEEMKADSFKVGIMHLARYLAIIYSMPVIIKFILMSAE